MTDTDLLANDAALRRSLTRAAYRMLGSLADAEDIVQDAWLRWRAVDRASVREPAAYLRTMVTRLCLNELSSARRRRETYVGAWLPDPLVGTAGTTGEPEHDLDRDITLPVMLALERLSPLERAAFLMHDVFGAGFDEIATALNREEPACRKLASRARAHIRAARPRFKVSEAEGRRMAEAFYAASRQGDMNALQALLSEDIEVHADGGGKVPATLAPTFGRARALALFASLGAYFRRHPSRLIRHTAIDGLPGFLTMEGGDVLQTTALRIEKRQITGIYVTRNPEKLRHLADGVAGAAGVHSD